MHNPNYDSKWNTKSGARQQEITLRIGTLKKISGEKLSAKLNKKLL
jgi:hypothetical protein